MTSIRIIGSGRAGSALALALGSAGWTVHGPLGRGDDPAAAAEGVDLLVIATPDAAIAGVAAAVQPVPEAVVAHLSGALGLDVLAPHPRVGSVHPLVSLPDAETGAQRLRGAWCAVAGDPLVAQVVEAIGGRGFPVPDDRRALYHAAACVAANHVVALLGQAARLAEAAGVPFAPFVELARGAVDNVGALGPVRALTGPAARGDDATLERHRAALPVDELALYDAGVEAARRLARAPIHPTQDEPGERRPA
jgi:predicted short-subunit dehydrogenase-like oxidoreductase (DUF2520 family)